MPARTIDIEPHRDWIVSQLRSGQSLHYIRCHMPLGGPPVSYNTLRRRLDAWGLQNEQLGERRERRRTRRDAGLEEARDWIVASYYRWDDLQTIRNNIQRELGLVLPERRLVALLHDQWELPDRRSRLQSPEVRELITELAEAGRTVAHIEQHLRAELEVRVSANFIRERLRQWGISPPRFWGVVRVADADVPGIKEFIEFTFFESKQSDAEMKDELETMGYHISLQQIAKFRREMGLRRRHQRLEADNDLEQLRLALRSHPRADILAPRLTKKMLPVFFKQEFRIPVSRHMAWRFMQENYPESMLHRVREVARRRGGFLCPGPNYIWSIDAYCKLAHWGIEVYACIDAYSRYIIWGHVGHTAQTQRSVCLQYTDAVRKHGYAPLIVRSDHGVETGMIAGAHYWLSAASTARRLLKPTRDDDGNVVWIFREVEGDVEVRRVWRAGVNNEPPHPTFAPHRRLEFRECYSYGVSTKNQRIESWWQELNYFITGFWREIFTKMEKEQDWSEFRVADRIALLYIYLPQVNWEIRSFIRAWNAHTIRRQRNRPHVVVGVPRTNYYRRDTQASVNCAVTVDPDALARLEEALEFDRQNISAYLPPDLMELCESLMALLVADDLPDPHEDLPLITEYRHLRAHLQRHEDEQSFPVLRLATKPTGGWPALAEVVQQTGRSLADILGEDIEDEFDNEVDL